MLYRTFGKTGWQVSAIGQGCWNIGNQWGMMSDQSAYDILQTAVDQGLNLFDVAESYGDPNGLSELRLGQFLETIDRDKVYLVSKVGNWGKRTGQEVPKTTPDMIRLCGHACCGRLRTDHLDVLLCHEGDIQDPSVYIEGFRQLRGEGFIRYYGISTNSLAALQRFQQASDGECAVVEVDYSLLNRTPEADLLPFCQEHNLGVLIRGPLAKGLLSGRYNETTQFTDEVRQYWNPGGVARDEFERKVAQVKALEPQFPGRLVETALRYVISHPVAPVAIPGATRPEQVVGNATAGAETLDATTWHQLQAG